MHLDQKFHELEQSLLHFLQEKFDISGLPTVTYVNDEKNAANILGLTGHYDPDEEVITIYVANRHPKDILRSLAHEFLHHVQKHEGEFKYHQGDTSDPNYIMHDNFLKMIEADAFERGNVAFREWEAHQKGYKDKKKMNESKLKEFTDKQTVAQHERAKGIAKAAGRSKPIAKDFKIAAGSVKKNPPKEESLEEEVGPHMDNENKKVQEVEVNEALENSLSYIPEERVCGEAYNKREEMVYNELLKKFGIKK